MVEGEVAFPTGKTWLDREHGVLRVAFLPGAHHDLESARQQLQAIERVAEGKRRPMLVDVSNLKSASREARALFGSPEGAERATAVAILSRSSVGNMIANVYLAVFGGAQGIPIKLFSSETEAIAWLKGFRT